MGIDRPMAHYDGKLIYSTRDEHGPIEVVDQVGTRTLYFGSRARQSTSRSWPAA